MDDLHTPTVPSGPTTTGSRAVNGVGEEKLSLMDLIAEKTRVEEELTALGGVLDSVCPHHVLDSLSLLKKAKFLLIGFFLFFFCSMAST